MTHDALVNLAKVAPGNAMANAKALLTAISTAVGAWSPADSKHRLTMATTHAEMIRTERNNACHPGAKVPDAAEIESHVMTLAHHTATFWSLIVTTAVANGFIIT